MDNRPVLADTSVWVDHLRRGNDKFADLLENDEVLCHPFVIGELACGNLKNRNEILALLTALPVSLKASDEEAIEFIERHRLMGRGLGYIDLHLLASAMLTQTRLWTLDKRLSRAAAKLGVD